MHIVAVVAVVDNHHLGTVVVVVVAVDTPEGIVALL